MVLLSAVLLSTPLWAQWSGNSSTDPIWRKGNVGIGLEPSSSRLSVYQDMALVGDSNFLKFQLSNQSSNFFGLKHSQNNNLAIGFDDGNGFDSHIIVRNTGRVGIGIAPGFQDEALLLVDGQIKGEEVKVEIVGGADFVFESSYQLRTLEETEAFINENQHLPEIASEDEMLRNGIKVGELNMKLLQKIEELTLYLIEQNKQNQSQQAEIAALKERVDQLEDQ